MIKEKDLRLNNLVMVNYKTDLLSKVTWIQEGSINVIFDRQPDLINGIVCSVNDLIPIKLTKNWFLNAGFKENKHGTLFLKLELDRFFEIIETANDFYCELVQLPELSSEDLMFITLRKIDYVHELQNLYFALKCEELVFCSTEP